MDFEELKKDCPFPFSDLVTVITEKEVYVGLFYGYYTKSNKNFICISTNYKRGEKAPRELDDSIIKEKGLITIDVEPVIGAKGLGDLGRLLGHNSMPFWSESFGRYLWEDYKKTSLS